MKEIIVEVTIRLAVNVEEETPFIDEYISNIMTEMDYNFSYEDKNGIERTLETEIWDWEII